MSELTVDERNAYEERLKAYKPTGRFGDKSINYFRQFVVDGELDIEGLMRDGYNERQIPLLQKELEAVGYIKPAVVVALEEKTVPELKKIAERVDVELPAGARKEEIVNTLAEQVDEADLTTKKRIKK